LTVHRLEQMHLSYHICMVNWHRKFLLCFQEDF